MSRSGYHDDVINVQLWRQAVARAIKGKRGQAFVREMAAALDAMPVKRLIAHEIIEGSQVCAMGAVCRARGLDVSGLDADDPDQVAQAVGLSPAMVQEIAYENDECGPCKGETEEERWTRMRAWCDKSLAAPRREEQGG